MRFLNLASAALVILTGCSKKKVEAPQGNPGVEVPQQSVAPANDVPAVTNVPDVKPTTVEGDSSTTPAATKLRMPKKNGKGKKNATKSTSKAEEAEATTDVESVGSTSGVSKKSTPKKKVSFDDLPVRTGFTGGKAYSVVEKEARLAQISSELETLEQSGEEVLNEMQDQLHGDLRQLFSRFQPRLESVAARIRALSTRQAELMRSRRVSAEVLFAQVEELSQIRKSLETLGNDDEALRQEYQEERGKLIANFKKVSQEMTHYLEEEKGKLLNQRSELMTVPQSAHQHENPWTL